MITFKCIVSRPVQAIERERVVAGLQSIYWQRFRIGADELSVEFTEVPAGRWFTAGKPSKASMVLGNVPAGVDQAHRVELMAQVCRMFSDATGASYHDVMVVAADPRPARN